MKILFLILFRPPDTETQRMVTMVAMFTLFRQLIQELAEYEKSPEGPIITVEELETDGFGGNPYFHCKVDPRTNPHQPHV